MVDPNGSMDEYELEQLRVIQDMEARERAAPPVQISQLRAIDQSPSIHGLMGYDEQGQLQNQRSGP